MAVQLRTTSGMFVQKCICQNKKEKTPCRINLNLYYITYIYVYVPLPDIPIWTEGFRHRGTYESTTLTSLAPSAHPLEAPRPARGNIVGVGLGTWSVQPSFTYIIYMVIHWTCWLLYVSCSYYIKRFYVLYHPFLNHT